MTLKGWVRPPVGMRVQSIRSIRQSPATLHIQQWGQLAVLMLGLLGTLGALEGVPRRSAQANEPVVQAAVSQLIFVHPVLGSDATGDGSPRSPFRTITHAARLAPPNTVILLAAGTYAADNGERFPILLPPGVAVQADPTTGGEGVVIQGQIAQGGATPMAVTAAPAAPNVMPRPATPRPAAQSAMPIAPQTSMSAEVVEEPAAPFPFAAAGAGFLPTTPTGDFPVSSGLNPQRGATPRTFGRAAGGRSPSSASAPPAAPMPTQGSMPTQIAPQSLRGIPISVAPPAVIYPQQSQAGDGNSPLPSQFVPRQSIPNQPISSGGFAMPTPVRRPVEQRAFRPLPQRTSQGGAVALSPSRQEPVANFQGVIEIPVPPPESSGRVAPRQSGGTVQRYERPPAVGRSPVAVPPAPPYTQYTLLPVPDPNAPIGNVSGVPSVPVSGARPRPTTPVASRASELGLRYRVVVPAASAAVQDRVLSVFPGAFLTYDRRQSVVMQVGAFNSEANAQEVIDILRQNGVRAQIERVD
ncbi:DUF1565 domain-containing protein [Thermoleptolyngbya sp. M55_K2018_002]|uniref:DUF1565 domain-containing protein n=1 Tax=Thermoleptolyngbya sp. M55_K2018_002 TaxID=2747808 RepID=UPI0019DB4306|nr:DUF1565 domain-containing protein [Thermoleptolyngbya sp. M55_K2018_002]HIK40351.1 DUF1565 domain-containing protein [Thermoleptolyngbya sp. M55_K2018_002]